MVPSPKEAAFTMEILPTLVFMMFFPEMLSIVARLWQFYRRARAVLVSGKKRKVFVVKKNNGLRFLLLRALYGFLSQAWKKRLGAYGKGKKNGKFADARLAIFYESVGPTLSVFQSRKEMGDTFFHAFHGACHGRDGTTKACLRRISGLSRVWKFRRRKAHGFEQVKSSGREAWGINETKNRSGS